VGIIGLEGKALTEFDDCLLIIEHIFKHHQENHVNEKSRYPSPLFIHEAWVTP
jgi:hypothetical protein